MKSAISYLFVLMICGCMKSCASSKVVVLRYEPAHYDRKLLCVTEDDGSSLIWNSHLNWNYKSYELTDVPFDTKSYYISQNDETKIDILNCNLVKDGQCLSSWDLNNWKLTDSLKNSMGPVFDERLQSFNVLRNLTLKDRYEYLVEIGQTGALVISIQGISDAHFLFCTGKNYQSNFCYWIIIGGWGNTKSAIRKCSKGVVKPTTYPKSTSECGIRRTEFDHVAFVETESRTFIIKWNFQDGNISVYDDAQKILSYTATEIPLRDKEQSYHIFARSSLLMSWIFHIYNFLHTTNPGEILMSQIFHLKDSSICFEMPIGLCSECGLDIILVGITDNLSLKLGTIRGLTTLHGLPSWQYVKINTTLPGSFLLGSKLKLVTKLTKNHPNPIWAVTSIRECPSCGSTKYISMVPKQDYTYRSNYFWPNVTCQKFFNNQTEVVSSINDVSTEIDLDDRTCPEGRTGPHCSIQCISIKQNDFSCGSIVLCEKRGCNCPSGYKGSQCAINCGDGWFGPSCTKYCSNCKRHACNYRTGVCIDGCRDDNSVFLPPMCEIEINVIPKPRVDMINQTYMQISIKVKDEYKKLPTLYNCYISQDSNTVANYDISKFKQIDLDSEILRTNFDNLKHGLQYWAACDLAFYTNANYKIIRGEKLEVTTNCTPTREFTVTREEKSLILDKKNQTNIIFPCPANWYKVSLQQIKGTYTVNGTIDYFPHTYQSLIPFTQYHIIVHKNGQNFYDATVRTLEGAPSEIQDLKEVWLTDQSISLQWKPPKTIYGDLRKYEITLKLLFYYGCNKEPPESERKNVTKVATNPEIKIENLQPYAGYNVTIIPYTSKAGTPKSFHFVTEQSETISASVSNLKYENNIISWEKPKDCKTITSEIGSYQLIFSGMSPNVKDFLLKLTTANNYYELPDTNDILYGAENYKLRVHIMRRGSSSYNKLVYNEIEFRTPPRPPPAVRNLAIYEIYPEKNTSVRWQFPEAPVNGEIEYFQLFYYNSKCEVKKKRVFPNEVCALWNDYICTTIDRPCNSQSMILISAKNLDVDKLGTEYSIPNDPDEKSPDAPGNFKTTPQRNGIISAKWSHPWIAGGHLKNFILVAEILETELRKIPDNFNMRKVIPISKYQQTYKENFPAIPSSKLKLTIYAETVSNKIGEESTEFVETASSVGFAKEPTYEVNDAESVIFVRMPAIVNDTKNCFTHVIVEGPYACENYVEVNENLRQLVEIKYYVNAWHAASFNSNTFADAVFPVGDDTIPNNMTNCLLQPRESYRIIVVLEVDDDPDKPQYVVSKSEWIQIGDLPPRHERWIIPIIVFILICIAAIYYYRRKRRGLTNEKEFLDEMPLAHSSQNEKINANLCERKTDISNRSSDNSGLSEKIAISEDESPIVKKTENDIDDFKNYSSLVKLNDFEDYVRKAVKSGELDKQYEMFPRGQTKPWKYGELPQNKAKNRYANLIAYDETRVVLEKIAGDPFSDYINANYIKGYKNDKFYIATQGPKPNTVVDFWRMVWQTKSLIICMLANVIENGKTKCEKYWPDVGKKKKYGDLEVLNYKHNTFADYTLRTFHVTLDSETRKIEHLHYTTWPDHGIPMYTHSVVTYLKKLLATQKGEGPIVVHCSAGVGRTGTIILCDICLRRNASERVVDVLAETASIRSQRANMVDNKQQYLLAHLTLVECLLSLPTAIPCNNSLPTKIILLKKQLTTQHQRLHSVAWQDEALRPVTVRVPLSENNLSKNRFPELLPARMNRVYLRRYPMTDEDSDYIAGVYVDGVRVQNQYFASQLPMKSTLNDFWRMIADFKVELIVMVQYPDPNDETCCSIVPRINDEFKPTPYIKIVANEAENMEYYTSQKLSLFDNSEKPTRERSVTILCFTKWMGKKDEKLPPVMDLVSLWQAAERVPRGDGPLVTLCYDGVSGCGLYLAMSFLLERMAVEQECDVCLAVRAIRRSRSDFVDSTEQLEFLYDAAKTYLEYFETYANFS